MSRLWLLVYGVLSIAQLTTIVLDEQQLGFVTQVLLMPALAVWVWRRGAHRLLLAALGTAFLGDVLMASDQVLPGMGAFALSHVCYIALFISRTRRRSWVVLLAYAAVWAAGVTALWGTLGELQVPVAVYGLLLTATAVTSSWYSWKAGVGGLVFLASDVLIGVRLAGYEFTGRSFLAMSLYCLAQYLLAGQLSSRPATRGIS